VARIELAPEVLDDFDRFFDRLARVEMEDARGRIGKIVQAIQLLTHSPLISRPAKGGRRELVIGRGSDGSVALYRFIARIAIRYLSWRYGASGKQATGASADATASLRVPIGRQWPTRPG
jgi:toxin ParE1/3/4